MLAHDFDGHRATFLRHVDLPTQKMNVHRSFQDIHQCLRMMKLMGEAQTVLQLRNRLIGVTEDAKRDGGVRVATNAGVMPAEPERLGVVYPGIIDCYALFGMLAAFRELAKVEQSGPLGVVGLNGKCRVAVPLRPVG